jgi:hypothetical protein
MDGGVGWDAVEPEDLVEAQAKQILNAGILLPVIGFLGNEPIKRGLVADNAVNQFLAKAPVRPGYAGFCRFQGFFQQIFSKFAAGLPGL